MNTEFKVPSLLKRDHCYDFGASKESFEVYEELNKIAEEIEACRLRNC